MKKMIMLATILFSGLLLAAKFITNLRESKSGFKY